MAKLIFGCGYLGLRVARRWLEQGQTVYALTRSTRRATELASIGLNPVLGDLTGRFELPPAADFESVLFAVGYDRSAAYSIHDVYVGGLQSALRALPATVGRFFYISSTGVYGQSDGQWVHEDSPCRPQRAGGQACLQAETALMKSRLGSSAIVLRLAGIYGPGRIPQQAAVAAGQPLTSRPDKWLNLIHVDDAVDVILRAERRSSPPRTYLVSDGNPVRREQFYGHLAELVGAPPPRFATSTAGGGTAARDTSDKRISNTRLVDELGIEFRYPSYRDGLSAIVGQ